MTSSRRGSYITTQLESINAQLQTLFDDLGVGIEERDAREKKVYAVIAEALELHVQQVKEERDALRAKCVKLQKGVCDMASALKDVDLKLVLGSVSEVVNSDLEGPYIPLTKSLATAFEQVETIYNQRLSRATKLRKDLDILEDKLDGKKAEEEFEKELDEQNLDLSNQYLSELEAEIQRRRNELQSRISKASMAAAQIVSLWAELGTPQDTIDRNIMTNYKTEPELLGTALADIERLESMSQTLQSEKNRREERINILSKTINTLWSKLAEDEEYIQNFKRVNRGLGLNALEAVSITNAVFVILLILTDPVRIGTHTPPGKEKRTYQRFHSRCKRHPSGSVERAVFFGQRDL